MSIDPSRFVYMPGVSQVEDVDLDEVVIHNAATGERVTEADLEAESVALERKRPWLAPGGKSLSGDKTHSPALRVVVSQTTADIVRSRAASEKMSVSKYLRCLIENAVSA